MVKDKVTNVYFLYLTYKFVNRDDYIVTRVAEVSWFNKTYCEDLTEGKFSYLIREVRYPEDSGIFSMLSSPIDVVRLRTTNAEVERFRVTLSKLDQNCVAEHRCRGAENT